MKKKLIILSTFCLALFCEATGQTSEVDSFHVMPAEDSGSIFKVLQPTYLSGVSEAANWGKNWFIEVKGGASAFMGSPIGCGDVYDRLTPAYQVGVGKWFTPAIGIRVEYQGCQLKNWKFATMNYHFIHTDFLWNVTSSLSTNEKGISKWNVVPFLGLGMIYNADWKSPDGGQTSGSHPFAFSYGVEVGYRVSDRLRAVAQLGGMLTAKNFDASPSNSRFGDDMLALSLGLSVGIGKVGHERIIDASPYICQNEWLIAQANYLDRRNSMLTSLHQEDERLIAEYNKILEIEGLLDLYQDKLHRSGSEGFKSSYPKNDYSGLNSLRARLANRGWDGSTNSIPRAWKKRGGTEYKESHSDVESSDAAFNAYMTAMLEGREIIGSPIFFFFHIDTANLTEPSQTLNIDEIAKVAKAHNLKVTVTGAADSATGTEFINETLSIQRAEAIRQLLMERGVVPENIEARHEGGIDEYSPTEANRQTQVTLSFK